MMFLYLSQKVESVSHVWFGLFGQLKNIGNFWTG